MRIYSVIMDSVCEGEKSFHIIGSFINLTQAQECLQKEYKNACDDYQDWNQDTLVYDYEDGRDSFDVYEDGYYDVNHISCAIEESEIRWGKGNRK